jgi:hypothetical protein
MSPVSDLTVKPRAVGFWAPLRKWASLQEPAGWPDPRQLVDPQWESSRRLQIAGYLRGAHVAERYSGFSYCRFPECTAAEVEMGDADLTDGFAYWPQGLAHYVAAHGVRLPEELVQAMEARGFVPPQAPRPGATIDGRWWLDWSAAATPAPPPSPDAISFEDAVQTAARLATPLFRPVLERAHGRWRAVFDEDQVDYLPPCGSSDLERYLLFRRRVPPEAFLSIAQANRIAREVFGARDRRRPRVSQSICLMRAPPDVWFVRYGSVQEEHRRTDELGWRHTLACFKDAPAGLTTMGQALRRGLRCVGCE